MAQNFVACDREQELLLPPSLREWLPEGHLAWFVIDAVAALDLSGFYAAYRVDGLGLCAQAGLLRAGVIAVDGTKVAANAAVQATRDYAQIVEEADAVDAA